MAMDHPVEIECKTDVTVGVAQTLTQEIKRLNEENARLRKQIRELQQWHDSHL